MMCFVSCACDNVYQYMWGVCVMSVFECVCGVFVCVGASER